MAERVMVAVGGALGLGAISFLFAPLLDYWFGLMLGVIAVALVFISAFLNGEDKGVTWPEMIVCFPLAGAGLGVDMFGATRYHDVLHEGPGATEKVEHFSP